MQASLIRPTSGDATLSALLSELRAAEQRGDDERVLLLRTAAVALRFPDGGSDVEIVRASQGDLSIVHALAIDLQQRRRYDEAHELFALALRCAQVAGDVYLIWLYELHAAQCCLGLLDLTRAAQHLTSVLGLSESSLSGVRTRVADAVFALAPANTTADDLHELRALALQTLVRYWAAVGRFAAAETTLVELITLLEKQPAQGLVLPELYILLAELRIDCGNLHGIEALRERAGKIDATPERAQKWQILEGAVLLMSGQLSRADVCLKRVIDVGFVPNSAGHVPHFVRVAMWQRTHVLIALNRLDDAEDVLARLASTRSTATENDPLEVRLLAALIAARRLSSASEPWVPITAKEVLEPMAGEVFDAPVPLLASRADSPHMRRCERVRDEWTQRANAVQLELHAGRIESAAHRFAQLREWTAELESPLIKVRCAHLATLVLYYQGHYFEASEHAELALSGYSDLGLPGDEWAVCRVYLWILRRIDAPEPLQAELREREQGLMARLKAGLCAVDRVLFALNKWSSVDEQISHLCRTLHERGDDREKGSWLSRLRQSFTVRATLQQMVELKRWEQVESTSSDAPVEPVPPIAEDVFDPYAQAQRQLRLRQHASRDVALRRVTPRWLARDSALLHYVVLPDRIELFLSLRSGCRLLRLSRATSRIELWHLVRRCLRRLYYSKWGDAALTNVFLELHEALGFSEVMAALPAQVNKLYIVPDDVLFHVPFAAVPVEKTGNTPLLSRFAVALLPALKWEGRRVRSPFRSGLGVAVAQAPGLDYTPLTHADPEIDLLRAQVPPSQLVTLRGTQATRAQVLSNLSQAQVAHFACHGEFDLEAPHRSGLLMHDGFLTVADLRSAALDSLELSVLSSCWGANVAVLPGRELVGVPMALIEQGAGMVITPLWRVGDAFSLAFVTELYTHTAQRDPIAQLASAQRRFFENSRPRDWASYVVYVSGLAPPAPLRWLLHAGRKIRRWIAVYS